MLGKAQALIAGRSRSRSRHSNEQLSLALQRLIEIIGEAAKNVSRVDTRAEAAGIKWPAIAAMRNRLIHAYFDVDLDLVWATLTDDFPPLMAALEALLTAEPPA